jgi:asparagine synthase (glutamine-hydrolysing)
VVAFSSQLHSPFNSFSIYFDNPRYDEAGFSRLAAAHFHTRHHESCLQAGDAAQAIPRLVEHYDEPFANSSAIGAYYCGQLARDNGVDVLLVGDGGDELFAGNERYAADKKFAMYYSVPQIVRKGIKSAARSLPDTGPLSYPARYVRRAEIPNPRRMMSYSFFLTQDSDGAFEPDFLEQAKPEAALDIAQAHFDSAHATSELNRLLYLDVKMTLADNDLRKVVGTAEMAGVRVRFPLLDQRLAELSGRIPSSLKLRGFEKRFIFKQAMKGILPDRILYKKKHGFGVPVGYWLAHDPGMKAIAAVLDEPQARQRGYFRPDFLSRVKELNLVHPAYYGEVLWVALVLELWHRQRRGSLAGESAECRVGVTSAS